jgi:signal transduction histidine kinase
MYKQAARSSGISFTTELEPLDGVFSKQDEISIYRIVQEAVNNIVKHSQASEAQVVIERQQEAVELRIRDNGRGFACVAAQAYPGRGGFGLIGMAERVRMMGGSFAVDSSAGEGTTIVIRLSVPQNGYQNDNSHRDR